MSPAAVGALTPVIAVNGSPLPANTLENLLTMRLESGLGVVGRGTFRFLDPGYAFSAADRFALGTTVRVSVPAGDLLFEGTVTGVNLEQSYDEQPTLTVVADHRAYALTVGSKTQTFLNMSNTDVAKKLVGQAGLTAKVASLGPMHEYLLQVGNALDYVDALVRRAGGVWWTAGAAEFHVAKAGQGSGTVELDLGPVTNGTGLLEFSVKASGLRPPKTQVSGWDAKQKTKVLGTSTTPSGPTAAFVSNYVGTKAGGKLGTSAAVETLTDPAPYTVSEAEGIATAHNGAAAADSVVARGTAQVNAKVTPMVEVNILNAGPASGKYVVTEVEHTYSRRGFHTSFVAGPHRAATLVDHLGREPDDAGLSSRHLVVGTVSNINDPDKLGRIKVTYGGLGADVESSWARVVTLGAGNNRGVTFMPEVDDEVLVAFAHGDTRRPVVIGALFSEKNAFSDPAFLKGNQVVQRRLTSRTGHIIEFADGKAPTEKHILLQLGTNQHKLRLGEDRFDLEIPPGKPALIKIGTAKIEISQDNITLEGMNVSVKAKGKLALEGTGGVEIKSPASTKVEGGMLDLKGSSIANLQGGSTATVKGGTVMIN
jgi:uncharacterized protein involved in type VI secretion and phage assembly